MQTASALPAGTKAYPVPLQELYVKEELPAQAARYRRLREAYKASFGAANKLRYFSVPGRSELGGNHTDHNHGRVLACSVDLDIIAAAAPTGDNRVVIASEGFEPDVVELDDLAPSQQEHGRSSALVRGVLARLRALGYRCEGFRAVTASRVLKGSGLSSSAAYEVMVAQIVSSLFNDGDIDPVTMAKAAQFAEREYFGKPCGLMDQTACAVGSFVAIDFKDPENPPIQKIDFDLNQTGYTFCIVDTRGDHADLTQDYAEIQGEMKAVAHELGQDVLRDCSPEAFYAQLPVLRRRLGDRAVLRAIHFFDDDARVPRQVLALKSGEFSTFLSLVVESGRSSALFLQNGYSIRMPHNQSVPVALCLTEKLLNGRGAWRVHGGGFGGTIQAFVPNGLLANYIKSIEAVFGEGSCHCLHVRPIGACAVAMDE